MSTLHSPSGLDVLIASADPSELDGMAARLGKPLAGRVGSLTVMAEPVGVGVIDAAVGTARAVARYRPRLALLIGSCGVYPERGPHIGQLVIAERLRVVDPGVVRGQAAFAPPMQRQLHSDAALNDALDAEGRLARVELANTLAITADDREACRLREHAHADVENLEAFGFGLACQAHAVRFGVLLGVTNTVGASGRGQWRQNRRKAAFDTGELAYRWLQRTADG